MSDCCEAVFLLDAIHDPECFSAGAAARTERDGAIVRVRFFQSWNCFFQERAIAFVGLGWKEFKRDDRFTGGPFCCVNISNQLHGSGDYA